MAQAGDPMSSPHTSLAVTVMDSEVMTIAMRPPLPSISS